VLPEDSAQFTSQKNRIPCSRPKDVIYHLDAHLSKASSVRTTRTFRLNLPLCPDVSRAHPEDTQCSTSYGISFQNKNMGRSLQSSGRCGLPSGRAHMASIAFKIQTFGRYCSWSGRVSIRYGNCVHQINRPDYHSFGPDARSLGMEITCSGSAIVQTTGHHIPNAAQIGIKFQRHFGKPVAQLSVRTTPRFYQATHSFEPTAYK